MAQTKPVIAIVNVVASATIEQRLDLNDITKKFPDVEWNPEQFPGAVFRLRNPKTATLIFRSGKMVCTGSKSEEMAVKAVNTVVQKLRKGKIKIKNEPIVTVQNIVSSINLGGKVNLEQAARTLPRSMYEPEQFPGLIHRMLDPKERALPSDIAIARLHGQSLVGILDHIGRVESASQLELLPRAPVL